MKNGQKIKSFTHFSLMLFNLSQPYNVKNTLLSAFYPMTFAEIKKCPNTNPIIF